MWLVHGESIAVPWWFHDGNGVSMVPPWWVHGVSMVRPIVITTKLSWISKQVYT